MASGIALTLGLGLMALRARPAGTVQYRAPYVDPKCQNRHQDIDGGSGF
jgi:hypothetical protein